MSYYSSSADISAAASVNVSDVSSDEEGIDGPDTYVRQDSRTSNRNGISSEQNGMTHKRRVKHHHHRRRHSRDVKILDGFKDGYHLGFKKKCVESFLILGALALAMRRNWRHVTELSHFSLLSTALIIGTLVVRRQHWSMPTVLYLYLFPIILTLVDYPQYLKLNILLAISSLPLSASVLSNIVITFSPETPYIYYLYASLTEIVNDLTTTSLSPTETSLSGVLLVNLLLNAKSFDTVYLRSMIFGTFFSLWPTTPLVKKIMRISSLPRHRRPKHAAKLKLLYANCIYSIFAFLVVTIVRFQLHKNLGEEPFMWLIKYMFMSEGSFRRLTILGYWTTWLGVGIPIIERSVQNWTIDHRRKVWHGMVVGMFLLYGVGRDAQFASLAISVALTLFFFGEFLRATTIPPLGGILHLMMTKYTDERDTCGPIIVSHIFLLLGIGLPIFWSRSPAGIICLGFGDACASIIGKKYGKHRWFDSKKTWEGTFGFVVAAFVGLLLTRNLTGYPAILGHDLTLSWCFLTSVATAILEATSGMNDNVIVPVYMYVVLRLGTMAGVPA
ncbi:hypothetical protein V1511DRAFT_462376 [Dipodascopsis uninucleata]